MHEAWGEALRGPGSRGAEPESGTVGEVVEAAAEEGHGPALALASYQAWLADEDASLPDLLDATMAHLRAYVSS